MGLFDKLKDPVFYKESDNAKQQLAALLDIQKKATGQAAAEIDQEIRIVKAGIEGERQIHFELEHSHIPMYVLHDLHLEHNGLTAQIDYLIITRKHNFVVECKNLYGNIEINQNGDFIRTISYGGYTAKEGIYSPVTQNRRHLDLIREIRAETKNILTRGTFEKNFYQNYRSVIVLSNPKTVLNDRYAPKDIRAQVIRADQLAALIRRVDEDPKSIAGSDKEMEALAQFFLNAHKEQSVDYAKRFRDMIKSEAVNSEKAQKKGKMKKAVNGTMVRCPKCGAPMVRRKATKGANAGKEFYGCSNYPQCRGIVKID